MTKPGPFPKGATRGGQVVYDTLAFAKGEGMGRASSDNPLALLKWKGQGSASAATPDHSWLKGAGEGKW